MSTTGSWFLEGEWKEILSETEQDTESQSWPQRMPTGLGQARALGSLCPSPPVPGPRGGLQLSLGLRP